MNGDTELATSRIPLLAAGALALCAVAGVSWLYWNASPSSAGSRITATRQAHAAFRRTPDAAYLSDPGLVIRGTFVAAKALSPRAVSSRTEIVAVESRQLAKHLATSLERRAEALPIQVPIALTTEVEHGKAFILDPAPLGRYSVYAQTPGQQPVRLDGVTVRDSIGGYAALRLRPAAYRNASLPASLKGRADLEVLPFYSGHWPDLEWTAVKDGVVKLERREPDGWPTALLWKVAGSDKSSAGWLRIDSPADGATATLSPCQLDDLSTKSIGPAALAQSPFAVLSAALRGQRTARLIDATAGKGNVAKEDAGQVRLSNGRAGTERSGGVIPSKAIPSETTVTEAPLGPSSGTSLRIKSRVSFASYQVDCQDGWKRSTFANVSGEAILPIDSRGPALVRAITSAQRLSLPTGVFLRPGEMNVDLPTLDILGDRRPVFEPRWQPPTYRCLCGFVTDHRGEPVANAIVALFPAGRELGRPKTGTTSKHGFYRIDGIRDGQQYTLRYGRSAGFGDAMLEQDWTAQPNPKDRATRIDLPLRGGSISTPVPKGKIGDVVVVYPNGEPTPVARAYLNEDGGIIHWRDLPRGTYRLVLKRESAAIAESGLAPALAQDGFRVSGPWRSL